MKNLLNASLIVCALLASSCASIYNPPSTPTPFLEKTDGIAVQASACTNLATNYINAGFTQAVTTNTSVNISGGLGLMGNYKTAGNPFSGSKKFNQLAVNVGFNTRKITRYPIQVWAGLHFGSSSDSYSLVPWDTFGFTGVTKPSTLDATRNFEHIYGNYIGTRFAISNVILTNYDANPKLKMKRKVKFDVVGTATFSPLQFKFKDGITNKEGKNALIGYNANARIYNEKRIFSLHLDFNGSLQQLFNETGSIVNPVKTMDLIPVVYPSISYTFFLNKKNPILQ